MKRLALTVATLSLMSGSVLLPAFPAGANARVQDQQAQSPRQTPQAKTFTGTISKDGDQFVLKDDAGKFSYQLDDQQTAGKFEGKRVKVTGTLDADNNLIRVQSIEDATA